MNVADFALRLGGGRRLVLAGIEWGWLWLLAGLVALGLVLALYRYERRLVSRRTGLTLLVLRVLAALALVAALFEPIAERTYRERIKGRVLVGVDLSESMATVDPGRPAESRERLRETLDLSPTETPESLPRREIARRLLLGDWLRQTPGRSIRSRRSASPESRWPGRPRAWPRCSKRLRKRTISPAGRPTGSRCSGTPWKSRGGHPCWGSCC